MIVGAGRLYFLLILAILAGAVALRLADPFILQGLRLIAFDAFQRLYPETYDPGLPVAIVDIDEESLGRVGQWPWPRTIMADLLDRLAAQGAAVVVFDILFAEADQTSPEQMVGSLPEAERAVVAPLLESKKSHDEIFAEAIGRNVTVLATALSGRVSEPPPPKAGFAFAGDDPRPFVHAFSGATLNLPFLDQAAAGIGSINWLPDRDQVIRRIPLVYRVGEAFVPSLVIEALRVAQGASTFVLRASNASGQTAFGEETGLNAIRVGDIEIPTDPDGGIWIKYRPSDPGRYVSAWSILSGENAPGDVAGRIVLVGTSAPGLIDLRATPLDASIAGVEVHAQAIEHILHARSLTRPDYALPLEMTAFLVLGLVLALILPRISASQSAVVGASVIGLVFVGTVLAFRNAGLLLDPTFPGLALLILVAAATLYVYRRVEMQRGEVRRAFSHYVSPAVVDELITHPEKLELGGVVRPLTLMFCDVRNFSSIAEGLTAAELTHFINSLLTPLSDIILSRRGTIDKYMGDAIMAFWNAPLDDPDHAAHACEAAREMVSRMEGLNELWRAEAESAGRTFVPVAIGIGINTGECLVGNLGSDQRFDYSALGDEVNVASRLEGLSKQYALPVIVGEPTILAKPGLSALEIDLMRVKGRNRLTRVYTLAETVGAEEGAFERLLPLHERMLMAFRSRKWEEAERLLADCRAIGIGSLEGLYGIYRKRIESLRIEPPPEDWDGATTAGTK